jgi:release factor glutamine methyltransferase
VLSNPPYVADGDRLAPEITQYEPPQALFAGRDGLDVMRRLAPAAAKKGAWTVALEVGAGQSGAVAGILREAGFTRTECIADLAGIERIVVGRR